MPFCTFDRKAPSAPSSGASGWMHNRSLKSNNKKKKIEQIKNLKSWNLFFLVNWLKKSLTRFLNRFKIWIKLIRKCMSLIKGIVFDLKLIKTKKQKKKKKKWKWKIERKLFPSFIFFLLCSRFIFLVVYLLIRILNSRFRNN